MENLSQNPNPTGQEDTVRVWDPLVRILHWGLVTLFAAAFISGDDAETFHRITGYAILGIIGVRIVWGLIGSKHARFSDFVRPWSEVRAYLVSLPRGTPRHYMGHNPAGGLMVIILLVGVAVLSGTGILAEEPGFIGNVFEGIHEGFANLMLGLVFFHVAGVLVASMLHGENLIRAMVTGRKRLNPHDHGNWRGTAIGILLVVGLLGGAGAAGALASAPSDPIPKTAGLSAEYVAACGECHDPYHPNLLPKHSWQMLMTGLSDHFGENATLKPELVQSITLYLSESAAEYGKTKAARRFSDVAASAPLQMTATSFWKEKHEDIPEKTFKQKPIGSKVNCMACHPDAGIGLFRKGHAKIPDAPTSNPT